MRPARSSRSIPIAAAILAGGVFVASIAQSSDPPTDPLDARQAVPARRVAVALATPAPTHSSHEFYAVTSPATHARLAFALGGRVIERPVEVGQSVRAGDTIARLDPAPLRNQATAANAQTRQLDAQIEQLQRDLERTERLRQDAVATTQQLEQVNAQLDALRAARDANLATVREARRQETETRVVAPWDGVVVDVFTEPGEVVAAGQPIALIADPDSIDIQMDVPESVYASVEVGDDVRIALPLSRRHDIPGVIERRGEVVPGRGRLFPVVVRVLDPTVVAGMAAVVALDVPVPAGVAVPLAAVVDPSGRAPYVLRVQDDAVERIDVDVLAIRAQSAILAPGSVALQDRVVTAGHAGFLDGERVEVAE